MAVLAHGGGEAGGDGLLVETAGGALDGQDPTAAIAREASEELGVDLEQATPVFAAYTSPGSTTQRLHFYAAPHTPASRSGAGGGLAAGEDVEVVELASTDALAMVREGRIVDAETIMMLRWATRDGPSSPGATREPGWGGAGLGADGVVGHPGAGVLGVRG